MSQELQAKSGRSGGQRKRGSAYLGQSVGEALAGTLGALSGRFGARTKAAGGVGKRRLEEVLERDRALREVIDLRSERTAEPSVVVAAPVVEPVPEPPVAETPVSEPVAAPASGPVMARARRDNDELACVEPIRTRTMARLLASQGYARRAAAIYEELLARTPDDAELASALAALKH